MMKLCISFVCVLGIACFVYPAGQSHDMSIEKLLNNLKTEHFSGKPINLDLVGASIETLFAHLEKSSGLSFELSSNIPPQSDVKRDYSFKQVPWDRILSLVLKELHLEATLKNESVYVQPKENNLMRIIREDQLQTPGSSLIPLLLYFLTFLALAGGGAVFLLHKKRIRTQKTSPGGFIIDPEKADEIMKKVTYMFDVEKGYRKDNISLQSLAEELSIPSYRLSWILNKKMNVTFSGLVNSYRIEEVKKRLASPQDADKTILDIAFDAGFNTKTSFNRVFKKLTRMTPSQYRQCYKAPY
jgi:AraC-like DNA-binding protein